MSYKVAPLTVNPRRKSSFLSKAFVSQPSAEEELLVGRLFVLMEIDQSRADDFALADFIVKDVYHHYYDNEQFFLRDKIANLKIDYIFEAAITKLNRGISEFLETQKVQYKPGGINMVIGVLHKNHLLFTSLGNSKTLLFYRPKTKSQMLADYNLMDISEKTEDPTQEIAHQAKLFANVINGSIPAGGYFMFANEALLEYISKKQLTEIVTTLPPNSAAEQIKILLEQTDAFVAFFALIVKNTVGDERTLDRLDAALPMPTAAMGGGRTSVDQFNTTQERTEELLTPSGVLTVKKWMAKLRPTSSMLKNYAQETARSINTSAHRLKNRKETRALGKKVVDIVRVVAALGIDAGKTVIGLVTNRETQKSIWESLKQFGKKSIMRTRDLITSFHGLKRKQKILLLVVSIGVVILIVNVAYSSIRAQKAANEARVAGAKTTFEQKEHQLEATLLYNNTDGAKQILDEMEEIINGLPNKTETEKSTVQDLTNRYHSKLDTIFAITRITNPAVYVALPEPSVSLTYAEGELLAGNGGKKTVYKVGTDKAVNTISNDSLSGKDIVVLTDGGDMYAWDHENMYSVTSLDNSIHEMTMDNKPNINTVAIYNNRLYAVSLSDNTIYRFNQDKRNLTFNGRQAWTKQPLTSNTVSGMAINGRVFLLADNKITRFSSGNSDNLAFEETTPALEEPKQIIATEDQSLVYVLDPKNHRVIAYTNDGTYRAQYTSDAFTNLTGVAVNEDNTKLYILNDKTVYEIEVKK